jgi:hypothetical protein
MITLEQLRAWACGLPEVEEVTHFGRPSFKVRGKPFAGIEKGGETAVFSVSQDEAAAAVTTDSDVYEEVWRTAGAKVFVGLRVDLASVHEERVLQLIEDAWRNKAPRRLVAAYDR